MISCGCKIKYDSTPGGSDDGDTIQYCSTHSQAFKMREALANVTSEAEAFEITRYAKDRRLLIEAIKESKQALSEIKG